MFGLMESARTEKVSLGDGQVLSPVYYPQYNCSAEVGIGSLQTRAHHEAARHGHPGAWTCDDVEAARGQSNELPRPWNGRQECPLEIWMPRTPLAPEERSALFAAVARIEPQIRAEHGLLPGIEGSKREEEAVQRTAVSRALVQRGILTIRRMAIYSTH